MVEMVPGVMVETIPGVMVEMVPGVEKRCDSSGCLSCCGKKRMV